MKEPTQVDNSIHAEAMGISIYCTPVPAMSFHLSSSLTCNQTADMVCIECSCGSGLTRFWLY